MDIEIELDGTGSDGDAVGSHDGLRVFVAGALPGERVSARITILKKTYAKATCLEVLRASPDRVQPPCPLFGKCGGCQLQHLSYNGQLAGKRQRVIDALTRISKFDGIDVAPCIASSKELGYRNKIQPPVKFVGARVDIGLYAVHSHKIVPFDSCPIHCELGEEVLKGVRALITSEHSTLQHLLIRSAVRSGQVLVVLVTSGETSDRFKVLAKRIMETVPSVAGVVENIKRKNSNTILGRAFNTLAGAPHLTEKLMDLEFQISAPAFFQVNPWQAESLYKKALEWAELTPETRVVDAFCGVGCLTLLAARTSKRVVGIECVPDAIENGKGNAKRNGLDHCEFKCGLVEELIPGLDADVVFLNPPRKGCEPAVLEALGKSQPQRIIYVSCDPATLARDLAVLVPLGFKINGVQPFDMFPQTAHVETVVRLDRLP